MLSWLSMFFFLRFWIRFPLKHAVVKFFCFEEVIVEMVKVRLCFELVDGACLGLWELTNHSRLGFLGRGALKR